MLPLINLFHVFFVAPLLYYLSMKQPSSEIYQILMVLGFGVLAYHLYRIYQLYQYTTPWINLFHVLFVAPLFIYIGNKRSVSAMETQLFFYLSIIVVTYHGYRAVTRF